MDLGLRDRVYVVTGGTSGLGLATAAALVADGARVVISSRRANAPEVAAQLGDGALGVTADNADPQTPALLIEAAVSTFGRFDGGLVSVGGPPPGTVLTTPDSAWRDAVESVFLGTTRLCREFAAVLGEGGSIAAVLSTSVKEPIGGLSISNGLRPGLAMMIKDLADEVGPRGVRVNALLPGPITTERLRRLSGPDRAGREAGIPLRRLGRPEEFGALAAFVLSPAASYLTGSAIPVDGGLLRSL